MNDEELSRLNISEIKRPDKASFRRNRVENDGVNGDMTEQPLEEKEKLIYSE